MEEGGVLTISLPQPGQVLLMDELVAPSSLFSCG